MSPATYFPPNLGSLSAAPSRHHRCGPSRSRFFSIVAEPRPTVAAPAATTTFTLQDHLVQRDDYTVMRSDYAVSVSVSVPPETFSSAFTYETSDPAVISAPADGIAIAVADGAAILTARDANGNLSSKQVTVTFTGGGSLYTPGAPVAGSLTSHCNAQIEDRIAQGQQVAVWSSRNDAAGQYAWNASCWGAGLANITCMSPWNSATGAGGGGVLVTPRHVLFSKHLSYYPKAGATIRYVRPDNVTETFTITDVAEHPWSAGWYVAPQDLVACKLDRDVPESIKFAKVLPVNSQQYLPLIPLTQGSRYRLPGYNATAGKQCVIRSCFTNQNKGLYTGYLTCMASGAPVFWGIGSAQTGFFYNGYTLHSTDVTNHSEWAWLPPNPLGATNTSGASGHPAFLVVNGELAVTNVWTSPYGGTSIHADAANINGMLDDLGGGYQLTEMDLAGFPTY